MPPISQQLPKGREEERALPHETAVAISTHITVSEMLLPCAVHTSPNQRRLSGRNRRLLCSTREILLGHVFLYL